MSGNLPSLTPKRLIRALEKIGFQFYRQSGSHRIYVKDKYQVVVPYHNKDLKRGTLHNIIKGTGLTVTQFIKYL